MLVTSQGGYSRVDSVRKIDEAAFGQFDMITALGRSIMCQGMQSWSCSIQLVCPTISSGGGENTTLWIRVDLLMIEVLYEST